VVGEFLTSPGGACTHWKAPPFHGARQQQTRRRLIRLLRAPDLINPRIATNAFIASHAAACTPSKLVN
jgi:hypothetical protein